MTHPKPPTKTHREIADLMGSGRANLRVRALGLVHDGLPKAFCVELVRQRLTDRSKRVRQVAANVARCFILSDLLPDLDHAAGVERDPDTRFQLEYAAALIRDVYFVYPRADGSEAFVIRVWDGYPAELLYPGDGWCTPADIAERGHRAVAEDIRRYIFSRQRPGRRPFRWDTLAG